MLVFDSSVLAVMGKRVQWCRLRRPRLRLFSLRPGWVRDQGQASRSKGPNGPRASPSCLLRREVGDSWLFVGKRWSDRSEGGGGFALALFVLKQEWNRAAQAASTHAERLVKNTSKVHDPQEGDPDRCCRLVCAFRSVLDKCRHGPTSSSTSHSVLLTVL